MEKREKMNQVMMQSYNQQMAQMKMYMEQMQRQSGTYDSSNGGTVDPKNIP